MCVCACVHVCACSVCVCVCACGKVNEMVCEYVWTFVYICVVYAYKSTCTCMYCMSGTYEHFSTTYSAENITWTENLTPITVKAFEKTPGPKVPIPRSAKEIFFLFFTPTLLELIVEQTNQYTAECMGQEV